MFTVESQRLGARLARRIRWVAVRGIASALAGVLVLGVGGRLAMLASRFLHPDAIGRTTENGNRIGEFTIEGTVALILFGGLLGGLIAGVIWVLVKEWIPPNSALVGSGVIAIGGFELIEADNPDFVILEGPAPDLVLLVGLLFAFGVVLHRLDRWFGARLPEATGVISIGLYSVLVAVAVPVALPTFGAFFTRDFCFCEHPPIWTGVFLVMTTLVTLWWWISHLRGKDAPSSTMRLVGRSSLLLAVISGAVHLTGQIIHIL